MSKYTLNDVRADFERTKRCAATGDYRHTEDYLEYLEESVIKFRQDAIDFEEFQHNVNAEIAEAIEKEDDCCDCCCGGGCHEN